MGRFKDGSTPSRLRYDEAVAEREAACSLCEWALELDTYASVVAAPLLDGTPAGEEQAPHERFETHRRRVR